METDCISPSRIPTIALGTAQRLNVKHLEIYAIDNFLTPDECSKIISIINSSELTTSCTYVASRPTERVVHSDRTSKTCYFGGSIPFITEVNTRICKTIGISNRSAEQIQGQKYEVGQ